MAEEADKITTPQLLGYACFSNGDLYVNWNFPQGAAYIRVTIYAGNAYEQNVIYRYSYPVTIFSDTIAANCIIGGAYIIGLKAFPIEESEKYTESDEGYTQITFQPETGVKLQTPDGLVADQITSASARVGWNAVANASDYRVEIKPHNSNNWQEVQ